jgi:hypothetical protein
MVKTKTVFELKYQLWLETARKSAKKLRYVQQGMATIKTIK